MNQRKAGAILSYVNIIAQMAVGLIYTPIMLRLLGQSEYGLYSMIGSFVAYLSILDMGLCDTIVRYTARNRAVGNKESEAELHGLFLAAYSVIGIVVFIVGCMMYLNIENIFGATLDTDQMYRAKLMMLMLVFNFTVTMPLSIFASVIQAYEKFIFLRVGNILRVVMQPLIVIPLLLYGYGSIMMVAVSTVINIVILLANTYYCYRYLDVHFKWGMYDKDFLQEIATYSFLIFLNVIMVKVYYSSGQFILGIVASTVEVAIYAVAMQFANMYMSFSSAISGVFLPKVTMMVADNKSSQELTDLMIKIGRLQFIIISYIFVMFALMGKDFLYLWAGDNYITAYPIILLVMAVLIIPLIQNLGISILLAMNLNKFRTYVYTIATISCFITSFPMAEKYGGMGCAISYAISAFISTGAIMNWYYHKRIGLNMRLFWNNIFKMMIPILIFWCLASSVNENIICEKTWLFWLVKTFAYSLVFIIITGKFSMNNYEKEIFFTCIDKVKNKII